MTTIIGIAWRNVWRNKLRTAVVVMAIVVGLSSGLFAMAFSRGFIAQLVSDVISVESAHLSVRALEPGAPASRSSLIRDAGPVTEALGKVEGLAQAAPRLHVQAMLSTAYATSNVTLTGILPDTERSLTTLHKRIPSDSGTWFESETSSPILIGRQLAIDLNAELNTRIVASFHDHDGNVVSTLFRVCGIFSYQNTTFERRNAFVLLPELAAWHAGNDTAVNEIAIRLDGGPQDAIRMQQQLSERLHEPPFTGQKLKVDSWMALRPDVSFFYRYIGLINTIFMGIILLALALVVVNTMLMVVHERTIELGVLRALGMKNRRLAVMMVYETLFMMLTGVAISLAVSWLLTLWLGHTGIDLSMYTKDYASPTRNYQSILTVVPRVYPEYAITEVLRLSIMVVITAMLSAWWPVKKVLKIQAARAVKEMM